MWNVINTSTGNSAGMFETEEIAQKWAARLTMQAPKGVSYVVEEVK